MSAPGGSAAAGLVALACLAGGAAWAGEPSGPAQAVAKRPATQAPTPDWNVRRGPYFRRNYGVDIVGVRRVASGLMLRFDYKVVDPQRASAFIDRKRRPFLIDEATGTALSVPAMENVGELRQVAPLQEGRTYFMIFGNPGGLVKKGGRVTVVAGGLRVEGLEAH